MASIVDLDHAGHYLHWGVVQISLANLIVILLMIAVFVVALLVPFPRAREIRHDATEAAREQRTPDGNHD
jgi:hypothetical protein